MRKILPSQVRVRPGPASDVEQPSSGARQGQPGGLRQAETELKVKTPAGWLAGWLAAQLIISVLTILERQHSIGLAYRDMATTLCTHTELDNWRTELTFLFSSNSFD